MEYSEIIYKFYYRITSKRCQTPYTNIVDSGGPNMDLELELPPTESTMHKHNDYDTTGPAGVSWPLLIQFYRE